MFLVIWQDRHADPSGHIFTDENKAVAWARAKGKEHDRHGDYEEQFHNERSEGLFLTVTYSCEGDCLKVWKAGPLDETA